MKNLLNIFAAIVLITPTFVVSATPEQDKEAFQQYFVKQFPDIDKADFANGVYALDQDARFQWESLQDFPPYEESLETGEELFNTPFSNGKTYADCFENGGENIRQNYPIFDEKRNMVITLEWAINECRTNNGEEPYKYKKGPLAQISAYMASTSEGSTINIVEPKSDNALAAYQAGKQYFYTKRGQLNFSCANCHLSNAGRKARSETLSTALGHPTHFPVYRMKWNGFGTMSRRIDSCNKQVRAQPLRGQSVPYRNLEYFLTYMSNGLPINGPASRK